MRFRSHFLFLSLAGSLLNIPASLHAQSIAPAADGTGTTISVNNNRIDINGGTLSSDGTNLFHSFQQFGLSAEQIANFLATPELHNILGRVVSGDPSVINGLIQVTGGNPNLYLMNPAGIIFGSGATLNVPADFIATTANGIGFGNNQWLNATGNNDYSNLNGNPFTFAFDSSQTGAIVNAGTLNLAPGKNLTLLGGTVVNTGNLSTPEGRITVAAVPGSSTVQLSQPGSLLSLEIEPPRDAQGNMAPITALELPVLLSGAGANTGLNVAADNRVTLAATGARISTATGSTVISGNLDVSSNAQQGGEINILGNRVQLSAANLNASGNGGGNIRIGGDYQGKGTIFNADRTLISQDSIITADAIAGGNGGRVIVWGNDTTQFYGTITARGANSNTPSNGGFVEVSGLETLRFDGKVDTLAPNGEAGTLLLDPKDIKVDVIGTLADFSQFDEFSDFGFLIRGYPINRISASLLNNATSNIVIQAIGYISFAAPVNITRPGVGLSARAYDMIFVGESITTNGGDIALYANENAGRHGGVEVKANINANGGNILLQTTSAALDSIPDPRMVNRENLKVEIAPNVMVSTTGTGTITLEGTGDSIPGNNAGIVINGTVRAESGNISITGNTNPLVADHPGIVVASTGIIESGSGNITLNGAAATQGTNSPGIDVRGRITSANGDITLNGTGASAGANSPGINLNGSVTSTNGNITLNATTQGWQASAIQLNSGSEVRTLGTGNIAMTGDASILSNGTLSTTGGSLTLESTRSSVTVNNPLMTNGGDVTATARENINVSSANTSGGDLTLNSIAGSVTAGNLATNGGNSSVTAWQNVNLASVATGGSNLTLESKAGNVSSGNLVTNGGDASVTAWQNLNLASAATGGGDVILASKTGSIATDNLVTNGGNASATARENLSLGSVNASGPTRGGDVTLNAFGNIHVRSINTEGSTQGGKITATTGGTFRATESFVAANGVLASLSSVGGATGGDITVQYDNKDASAFVVGNASLNGTQGGITTGSETIDPQQTFPFTHRQGNIALIGADAPPPPPPESPPESPPELTPLPPPPPLSQVLENPRLDVPEISDLDLLFLFASSALGVKDLSPSMKEKLRSMFPNGEIERDFFIQTPLEFTDLIASLNLSGDLDVNNLNLDVTALENHVNGKLEDYLRIGQVVSKSAMDARQQMRELEAATGVKPALIYAVFVPNQADETGSLLVVEGESAEKPDDVLELMLMTSRGTPTRYRVGATRQQVLEVARRFQATVASPIRSNAYLAPAQQLYQWLIAPLEADLQQNQIQNLVLVADSGLRLLPFAALHDGKGFVVERYSMGLIPSLALTDLSYRDIRGRTVLAMGANEFKDREPLPGAVEEASLVAGTLWRGDAFLNDDFTLENLQKARDRVPYGIIHLATHADFLPGDASQSYIQVGDTPLPLDRLRTLGWNEPAVELLVLSACRTAIGDENAELGFSGLAVLAGVKTAIGSLWSVNDVGTLSLMAMFYEQLQQVPIKAEALRQAQLAMLQGRVKLKGGTLVTPQQEFPLSGELGENRVNLSHPFYWSGFTAIGNPW